MSKVNAGRLERWAHVGNKVWGELHEDNSGESVLVRTSLVIKLDRKLKTLETENSIYTLGEPWKEIYRR